MRYTALLIAALGAAGPAAGQQAGGGSAEADRVVLEAVSEAWDVPVEAIVLDWGRSGDAPVLDATSVELMGSGGGGTWVARMRDANGDIVARRVRAGRSVTIPVAARRLERGTVLEAQHVEVDERVEWGPPGTAVPETLVGLVTQRVVQKGDVLAEPAVRAPDAVTPGAPVALRVLSGKVRLEVAAVGAGAGMIGEQVYVRTESGERVRGVVVGHGVVDVIAVGSDPAQRSAR